MTILRSLVLVLASGGLVYSAAGDCGRLEARKAFDAALRDGSLAIAGLIREVSGSPAGATPIPAAADRPTPETPPPPAPLILAQATPLPGPAAATPAPPLPRLVVPGPAERTPPEGRAITGDLDTLRPSERLQGTPEALRARFRAWLDGGVRPWEPATDR
jgi:predicted component of type VI protein secretion system